MDPLINGWSLSAEEVCNRLGTDRLKGLSSEAAAAALQNFGPNQLPDPHKISPLKILLSQFMSVIIWMLIGAAAIAGALGEWIDAFAIITIVCLNAVIGFFQEFRAENSLAELRKMTNPVSRVKRNNRVLSLPSSEIVPGDIVLIEAGDKIPADGRILECVKFQTQEASLTGESQPVRKSNAVIAGAEIPLGDRRNMVFMGTTALTGKCEFAVIATGLHTEIGKIARMLQSVNEEKTPLQIKLDQLGKRLALVCLAVVALVFILGILRGNPALTMFLTALSLAVAAIPEGLPAVVTVTLALGVRKMAKRNALIRRLPSVETLGCASVICSDKTGTLTKNEMTVQKIFASGELFEISGVGYGPKGDFKLNGTKIDPASHGDLNRVLMAAALCNDAQLVESPEGWKVIGDPTEGALLTAAGKAGLFKDKLEESNPKKNEIPFDSERKRMGVLRQTTEGLVFFVKGAPDVILRLSDKYLLQGKEESLQPKDFEEIEKNNRQLASQAYRVLAMAYRKVEASQSASDLESLENGLVFAGLTAMLDPPRPEARKANETCRHAGIFPVMITGDHKETALAVAKDLGMPAGENSALNGYEIDNLTDEQLAARVSEISVYSRVTAEHKLRVVRAWKKQGAVVAMTGDGVNDAPAIKEADIGIAMGITGTEVTKEASDMVITDDNFASIVNAVEEGRGIYDNIVKFVKFLLSYNLAEILLVLFSIVLGITDKEGHALIPLTAVQILWMNLVTDGFPAIALGLDPISPDAMNRPPRHPKKSIFSRGFLLHAGIISLLAAAGAFAACLAGLVHDAATAQTMALTTLVMLELMGAQMVRSVYKLSFFSNKYLLGALAVSWTLQLGILYIPVLQKVFGVVPLDLSQWAVISVIGLAVWGLSWCVNKIWGEFFLASGK